jgi:hypothetical protein
MSYFSSVSYFYALGQARCTLGQPIVNCKLKQMSVLKIVQKKLKGVNRENLP